jgi:hypothetical protein
MEGTHDGTLTEVQLIEEAKYTVLLARNRCNSVIKDVDKIIGHEYLEIDSHTRFLLERVKSEIDDSKKLLNELIGRFS